MWRTAKRSAGDAGTALGEALATALSVCNDDAFSSLLAELDRVDLQKQPVQRTTRKRSQTIAA